MNVLFAIDSFYDGGAEMFAIRLANSFSKTTNHKCYFVAMRPWLKQSIKQEKLLQTENLIYINALGTFWLDLLWNLLFWVVSKINSKKYLHKLMYARLRYICKAKHIQLVNSHSYETDYAFSELKIASGLKLVCSFHGHYELFQNSWKGFEESCQKLLAVADAVVYLSDRHVNTLDSYQVPEFKRAKIFYGVPIELAQASTTYTPPQKLRLLMAARGIKEKGWGETLEALDEIYKEKGDIFEIQLLGTGPYLDLLQEKYKDRPYLSFLGYCDNIIPYVEECHICLLPSYYLAESLPNSVIEYLMCGKPVVTSDVGAIPEMVTHESHIAGYILQTAASGISYSDIKQTINSYLESPALVQQHSKIALKAAEKFKMQNCVSSYNSLFINIMNN